MLEFAADDDFFAGYTHDDMHVWRIADGLLAFVRHLDRDAAADM